MDLRNNKITLAEILRNPKGEVIIGILLPQLMNPFLLHKAENMSLENILKLASGPGGKERVSAIVARLKAI